MKKMKTKKNGGSWFWNKSKTQKHETQKARNSLDKFNGVEEPIDYRNRNSVFPSYKHLINYTDNYTFVDKYGRPAVDPEHYTVYGDRKSFSDLYENPNRNSFRGDPFLKYFTHKPYIENTDRVDQEIADLNQEYRDHCKYWLSRWRKPCRTLKKNIRAKKQGACSFKSPLHPNYVHQRYATCCPRGYFGRKNQKPFCKHLEEHMNSSMYIKGGKQSNNKRKAHNKGKSKTKKNRL